MKYDPRQELHRRTVSSVAEELLGFGVDMIVISGGEPLGQQERLVPLIDILVRRGIEIEIETNGTHPAVPALVDAGVRFNVSPKLAHSGDLEARRIVPSALTSLAKTPGAIFKFVCRDTDDLDEVAALVSRFGLQSVWIMPEGQSGDEIGKHMTNLADSVVDRGWNITTRLHTLVWGKKRAV